MCDLEEPAWQQRAFSNGHQRAPYFTDMLTVTFSLITGDRITYDRTTLLTLANSPLSKAQPGRMAYVAGITKSASVPSGASFAKKSVEQKKEERHKKKSTCKYEEIQCWIRQYGSSPSSWTTVNPFELLNDGED